MANTYTLTRFFACWSYFKFEDHFFKDLLCFLLGADNNFRDYLRSISQELQQADTQIGVQ